MLTAVGCASPVGYKPISPQQTHAELTASVLSSGKPSATSNQLLARLGLAEQFRRYPAETLETLRAGLGNVDEAERLFALAELSLVYAQDSGRTGDHLAAAVYAYAFAFPNDRAVAADPYDPRLRLAIDIYNRGITAGLASQDGETIDLDARQVALPWGTLVLASDFDQLEYEGNVLGDFVAIRDIRVRGLRNTYRQAGIGAPVVTRLSGRRQPGGNPWLVPNSSVPATVFVRFENARAGIDSGALLGRIELYDVDEMRRIDIDGHDVPLEWDPSASIAYGLEGSPIWDFEVAGFRRADFRVFDDDEGTGLYMGRPYRPGRVPVVLVHGTASSPARWAELVNELRVAQELSPHIQVWFFIYNTGNPVWYSAMRLRNLLGMAIASVTPADGDPALHEIVLIGHSQGGLLTKMQVVSTGDRLWKSVSTIPFDEARLSKKNRDLLEQAAFFEPVPEVSRVIFIATPHRGSFLAAKWTGRFARRLVRVPAEVTKMSLELITLQPPEAFSGDTRGDTSIDFMTPGNPTLLALADLPIADGVAVHSIVAVKGDGPAEEGNDGVVEYRSAHLEGTDSEFVVRAEHSCQSRPEVIEEIRRILNVHLEETGLGSATMRPAPALPLPSTGR